MPVCSRRGCLCDAVAFSPDHLLQMARWTWWTTRTAGCLSGRGWPTMRATRARVCCPSSSSRSRWVGDQGRGFTGESVVDRGLCRRVHCASEWQGLASHARREGTRVLPIFVPTLTVGAGSGVFGNTGSIQLLAEEEAGQEHRRFSEWHRSRGQRACYPFLGRAGGSPRCDLWGGRVGLLAGSPVREGERCRGTPSS